MKDCMSRLLFALDECGEAAVFYREHEILMANRLFADLFAMDADEFSGKPILDIIHDESVDMIQDFIRRRAFGDANIPSTYTASFRSGENEKFQLEITVLRTANTEDALLVIAKRK